MQRGNHVTENKREINALVKYFEEVGKTASVLDSKIGRFFLNP